MKKFLSTWITPITTCVLVLIRVPDVEAKIKEFNDLGIWILSSLLVLGTVFNHYINVVSPLKKYERIAKNRWFILETQGKLLVDKYKKLGVTLKINIMVPRFSIVHFLEPWFSCCKYQMRKPTIFGKYFEVIWNYGNGYVSKQLKISVNQGACGSACIFR